MPQWMHHSFNALPDAGFVSLSDLGLDPTLKDIITRLRSIFVQHEIPVSLGRSRFLSTTDFHDLACFVLHRLLLLPPFETAVNLSATSSECMRLGVSVYTFLIHGSTYYSHAVMVTSLVAQLKYHLERLVSSDTSHSLLLWLMSIGTVASLGTNQNEWFRGLAITVSLPLGIGCWEDVEVHLRRVLWLDSPATVLFQQTWEEIIQSNPSLQNLARAEDINRS